MQLETNSNLVKIFKRFKYDLAKGKIYFRRWVKLESEICAVISV